MRTVRKKITALLSAISILIMSGCANTAPTKMPTFIQAPDAVSEVGSQGSQSPQSSQSTPEQSTAAPEQSQAPVSSQAPETSRPEPASSSSSSESVPEMPPENPPVTGEAGVTMTIDDNGLLSIERRALKSTPMGDNGSWTVFVYMCGSDLESRGGAATADLNEMVDESSGANIKYIVQTGGAKEWNTNMVSSSAVQRFIIEKGSMTKLADLPQASMGDGSTLESFVSWGVENYPAEKMGLVFWNHGGGTISGVCNDENYSGDSLSLTEIDDALRSADKLMTDAFEFIGFDTCLMATIEMANICANYSRYLLASEEVEPSPGWNYKEINKYIGQHPECTGRDLGQYICDSYYNSCTTYGFGGSSSTLSLVDLTKIDDLLVKFNTYAGEIYNATENNDVLSQFSRNMNSTDNFGGNNFLEGYTNMVDLGGLIQAGSEFSDKASAALAALSDAVIYAKNGRSHANACGLSIFYPLKTRPGSKDLSIFGDVAVSPYYLALVTRSAYNTPEHSDPFPGFGNNGGSIFDMWNWFWGDDDFGSDIFGDPFDDWGDIFDDWGAWDEFTPTGESSFIKLSEDPKLGADGTISFAVDKNTLDFVEEVDGQLFLKQDDLVYELGNGTGIDCDWTNGRFSTKFDESAFCLPNNSMLAAYIVSENGDSVSYTSRVTVNDIPTNLRFTYYKSSGKIEFDGTWEGLDLDGMASREINALKPGDVIVPLYHVVENGGREYDIPDLPYTYGDDFSINRSLIMSGEYLYGFTIYDIFGDSYRTADVPITIKRDV